MKTYLHLLIVLIAGNLLLTTFVFADVPPEPGEVRTESPTARLRRQTVEVCVGAAEGSACAVGATMKGVCRLNPAAQGGPVLQCDLSQPAPTAVAK